MVLRVCRGCTALFPPGMARCPQCDADDHYEQGSEEQDMPKISKAGGPTVAGVPGMDNQSDRPEDQPAEVEGGMPDRAELIERAATGDPVQFGEQAAEAEQGSAGEDYSAWTYNDLQAECKARGLTATGSHQVLAERLAEDDQATGRP